MSPLAVKNCWTLAEHAGHDSRDGLQHLLRKAKWDADGVRDDLRRYVVERLRETGGVLVVDLYEDGGMLNDPRLVEVRLHNTGTAAVSEAMYDGQQYVVRFGTSVIGDLLRQGNSATGQSKPPARLTGDELRIGPGAIHPNQQLIYPVLVDGQESIEQISPLLNEVGHVALDPSQRAGLGFELTVHLLRDAGEADEPVALYRGLARDGFLGLGDLFVDPAQGWPG